MSLGMFLFIILGYAGAWVLSGTLLKIAGKLFALAIDLIALPFKKEKK